MTSNIHQAPTRVRPVLITGGAGFIGANLAHRLLSEGRAVIVFDDLSRAGVEANADWLRARHGEGVHVEVGDVRDPAALRRVVREAGVVFHLAAQVAVTRSLIEPLFDFDVNARGTLNLLEALRSLDRPLPLVYTSTNKVYGALADLPLRTGATRHEPTDAAVRELGVSESRHVDFQSPYGCSKGAADSYVLDYARTYRLPATVLRMSCIYGPRQLGTEDQGWVAHFMRRVLDGAPLTIFGDGRQVRDLLFIDDLIDALLAAEDSIAEVSGRAFNIGGGPANSVSLLELLDRFAQELSLRPCWRFEEWRPGDQRYYVSDTRGFGRVTQWTPRVDVARGLRELYGWLVERGTESPAEPGLRWQRRVS